VREIRGGGDTEAPRTGIGRDARESSRRGDKRGKVVAAARRVRHGWNGAQPVTPHARRGIPGDSALPASAGGAIARIAFFSATRGKIAQLHG
jgi:hypothetical protein